MQPAGTEAVFAVEFAPAHDGAELFGVGFAPRHAGRRYPDRPGESEQGDVVVDSLVVESRMDEHFLDRHLKFPSIDGAEIVLVHAHFEVVAHAVACCEDPSGRYQGPSAENLLQSYDCHKFLESLCGSA